MNTLLLREPGPTGYTGCLQQMQAFTSARGPETPDEIWLTEHAPVYSLGRRSTTADVPDASEITVVHSDRGGLTTYHGPGQLVVYLLLDLRRNRFGVRDLVSAMEESVIELLGSFDILASARPDAPGVYVNGAKIASLGLRVRNGASYHGLALNLDMDLAPFSNIRPCGLEGIRMTRTRDLGLSLTVQQAGRPMAELIASRLGYDQIFPVDHPDRLQTGQVLRYG